MPIDLRSDTVTMPTAPMLEAMMGAALGDDVLGDDPTVLALQNRVARLMGKEAACFVPSGTMANQTAIRAHTEPGDEVITHQTGHTIHYETGAPAALSGVMVRTLTGDGGMFDVEDVHGAIRPDACHFPRSRLLIVENTSNGGGGTVWPLARVLAVASAGREHGLRLHLDGARLWNACAASGTDPAEYAAPFDTVSCCFSKGLGAPVGSAVAGDADTIRRVHRFRKLFGGAMRQAGLLAAACLYALEHHRDRLVDDHANARRLAEGIDGIEGLSIDATKVESNIVIFGVDGDASTLCARLEEEGVRMLPVGPRAVRAVTHLGVSRADIEHAVASLETVAPALV